MPIRLFEIHYKADSNAAGINYGSHIHRNVARNIEVFQMCGRDSIQYLCGIYQCAKQGRQIQVFPVVIL